MLTCGLLANSSFTQSHTKQAHVDSKNESAWIRGAPTETRLISGIGNQQGESTQWHILFLARYGAELWSE